MTGLYCRLPSDKRFRASVANGYFGTIVYDSIFHLNGFYNGKETDSTFVKVPNPIAFWLNTTEQVDRIYTLDMYNGIFIEKIFNEKFEITVTLCAHQKFKSLMCAEVEMTKRSNTSNSISIDVQPLALPLDETDDIIVLDRKNNESFTFLKITSKYPERDDFPSPNVTIVSTILPEKLHLEHDEICKTYTFVFSATVNNDQLAWDNIENALELRKLGMLFEIHTEAWNNLWKEGGSIDILGNCSLAKKVNSAFYYITSSMPMGEATEDEQINNWPFFGICPTSLAQMDTENETYWGHVFWDQETWMLPPIQVFYPDVIKRIFIESRFRNLNSAKGKAKSLGYDGAMYPWESAYTGYDTSPWLPAVLREIHITGDLALAMQQYLYYTRDDEFVLENGAYNVICEIAKFWASRLTFQKEHNAFGIIDAMGPDEHHDNVNNSAYLNAIAQLSLRLPEEIYKSYNIEATENVSLYLKPDPAWLNISENIYIPFDPVSKFHPEFDGYNISEQIKQADVVLLGYPLMFKMSEEVRRNDLDFYEKVTSLDGPAMTWGMHAIGWLEVDEHERAGRLFEKNFAYIKEPFNVHGVAKILPTSGKFSSFKI